MGILRVFGTRKMMMKRKKITRRRETGDLIGASCLTPSAWTLENDFMFINKLSKKKKKSFSLSQLLDLL